MIEVTKDGRTIDHVERLRLEDLFLIENTIFRFKTKKSIYLGPCASNRWFDTRFELIRFGQIFLF
jgi:hypothetical protein